MKNPGAVAAAAGDEAHTVAPYGADGSTGQTARATVVDLRAIDPMDLAEARMTVAFRVLHQLPIDEQIAVADRTLRRAGVPIPPFSTFVAEADNWASSAGLPELKAYFAAIVARLPRPDRIAAADAIRRSAAGK